jgi:hypothetical protein
MEKTNSQKLDLNMIKHKKSDLKDQAVGNIWQKIVSLVCYISETMRSMSIMSDRQLSPLYVLS